mgnify:CR=1 FL=1
MVQIIKGEVIPGNKLGRILGFPTANIALKPWKVEDWVYKVNILLDKNIYHWAATYLEKKWVFEVHIFNFNQDIYWKKLKVIIFDKIRNNKMFSSESELKQQIKIDIITIKNLKDYVLTFWTFDVIHPWHEYFLKKSRLYWDRLVTIVATDKNVEKFKKHKSTNTLTQRLQDVKDLKIADIVSPWNEENPLIWIKLYMPKVICLWYDQVWFTEKLEEYIQSEKLNIFIKRIKPYKEEKFKSSIIKKQKKDK